MKPAPKCKAIGCSRKTRKTHGYCWAHADMVKASAVSKRIDALDQERINLHTALGQISTAGVERKDFITYWPKVFRLSMIANDLAAAARDLVKSKQA